MTSISWIYWGAIAAWGLGAILWVEVVRDLYHVLAHVWAPLGRLHNWHHRVFRPDLTPSSALIYRQAQWYNDVPEACVMIAMSLVLWGLAHIVTPELAWGCGVGSLYATGFLLAAMARGMGWTWAHEMTDITHLPGPFVQTPSRWWVNRPYHWRHHFDNQNAYFCSTLTLVDQVMGTALSLKGKTVAVTGGLGNPGSGPPTGVAGPRCESAGPDLGRPADLSGELRNANPDAPMAGGAGNRLRARVTEG